MEEHLDEILIMVVDNMAQNLISTLHRSSKLAPLRVMQERKTYRTVVETGYGDVYVYVARLEKI